MRVAVRKEIFPGERRVSLVPGSVPALIKAGFEVVVESGAGEAAGFSDDAYRQKGAEIALSADQWMSAPIILSVLAAGADAEQGAELRGRLRAGQTVIGMCDPLGAPEPIQDWAQRGVSLFSLELIPRITRAQSMDVLSSQATIAGYRAVLLAATELPKMFPMLMTAAGTITAAKVLILGVGVAGLQAIAVARKLGAVVSAYDVRTATREQVESLGGRFVDLGLDTASAEDRTGYAKALDESFYAKQRELLAKIIATQDAVICTAAIPGKRSPLLVTAAAVAAMRPRSVIVDLAAQRGGNCELTRPDQRVIQHQVTILGPTNIAAHVALDASQMFSHNVTKFLLNLVEGGQLRFEADDPIIRETLVTHGGEVVQPRLRAILGLPPLEAVPK
ncbi:MAG: NAD(P) transhydrogenase subunit alpha [Aureliella sp.]